MLQSSAAGSSAPEWIGLTVSPCSVPDAFTVVFENIPIPPELTKAVEME